MREHVISFCFSLSLLKSSLFYEEYIKHILALSQIDSVQTSDPLTLQPPSVFPPTRDIWSGWNRKQQISQNSRTLKILKYKQKKKKKSDKTPPTRCRMNCSNTRKNSTWNKKNETSVFLWMERTSARGLIWALNHSLRSLYKKKNKADCFQMEVSIGFREKLFILKLRQN